MLLYPVCYNMFMGVYILIKSMLHVYLDSGNSYARGAPFIRFDTPRVGNGGRAFLGGSGAPRVAQLVGTDAPSTRAAARVASSGFWW
eukprot:COSAG01_NODE_8548_length_2746_cov_3.096713_2_plen_87_part_00